MKKLSVCIILFPLFALFSGCATPYIPAAEVVKPPLYAGKYKSAAVGVFGSADGVVKIDELEAANIGERMRARLSEDSRLKQVTKYSRGGKKPDLYIFIYVQEIQTMEKPYYNTVYNIPVRVGYRRYFFMRMLTGVTDTKTKKVIGTFECDYTTPPLQGGFVNVLGSDEVENINEQIFGYLQTLF